jgi:CheY-like chemotaxis protein
MVATKSRSSRSAGARGTGRKKAVRSKTRSVKAASLVKKRLAKAGSAKKRVSAKRGTGNVKQPRVRAKTERQSGAASRMVQEALAAFAHEVRTPLTGILAVSDLLATSDLDERERRWIETIRASADHLSALATLFVDAARSSKTGSRPRHDFFDLHALARTAADSLAGRAVAKGLRSSSQISDRLPVFVTGDPVRLRAALENLIDNAVKFTDQGHVDFKVSVVRSTKSEVSIAFAISDSGIGLSLAEIKGLFRPFSQANVTIAARFGGAGLGLSSVKQIARTMGGDIAVSQRSGGGTVFTLTVVLNHAKDSIEQTVAANDGAQRFPANPPLRILSVEDNPFGRVVLNAILTELGHQAEFIGEGESALSRVETGDFDAVLMDMVLPGIDGVETIRRIRTQAKACGRIAIIGISGRNADENAARNAGADGFLLKPVSPRALATALLEATRRAAIAPS